MKSVITLKSILRILGIIACAAVIITMTACSSGEGPAGPVGADGEQGPAGPVDVFTVTFDSDGGNAVAGERVINGGKAREPAVPTKAFEVKTGYTQGLYKFAEFVEWQKDGVAFDFDTPITGDITLKAKWTDQTKVDLSGGPSEDIINKAIYRARDFNGGSFAILINENIILTGTCAIHDNNTKVTIIGIGAGTGERKISKTDDNTALFELGQDGGDICSNISLTIGDRITLQGKATNEAPVVTLFKGSASFTMLPGSKITGNKTTGAQTAGAVNVGNGGLFTMEGGSITGNTADGLIVVTSTTGKIVLKGGSITGNTAPGDVMVDGSVTLSGNAQVGSVILVYHKGAAAAEDTFSPLNLAPAWTGSVKINLMAFGADETPESTSAAIKAAWNGKAALKSATSAPLAFDATKVTLGKYILVSGGMTVSTADFAAGSGITAAGVLDLK